MTLYIGVDPGVRGAIAFLDGQANVIQVEPMPLVSGSHGARDQFDLPAIRDLLIHVLRGEFRFVTVERSQPLPPAMGGSIANFARGVARGFEWLLVGLGIPYQLVAPRQWQKVMHTGTPGNDTKQRSILAAQRLFPGVDLRRSAKGRKADHNLAEAVLLAALGHRTRGETPGQPAVVSERATR